MLWHIQKRSSTLLLLFTQQSYPYIITSIYNTSIYYHLQIKHGGDKPHGFRLAKRFNLCVMSQKLPHIVKASTCCSATSTWLWAPPQDFQCKWQKWKKCASLPSSVNCHPYLRESCKACPSKAAWCINFLGIQPTFTHVPPRPEKKEQNVVFTSV